MSEQRETGITDNGFGARLVAEDGTEYELSGEQTLGRSPDADITIANPKISRSHARFRVADQQLSLEDLGSANGTRVNQRRIDGIVVLSDGDVVSFDAVDFKVVLTGVSDDDNATIISYRDDATIVGAWPGTAPAISAKAAPQSPQLPPKSEPATAKKATPPPTSSAPQPVIAEPPLQSKSPAGPKEIPGAWVNDSPGEFTRVLAGSEAAEQSDAELDQERASDLPHLIIILKSGARQVLELEPAGGESADVWEIGRDQSCQIPVLEESVSARHAQLIHQKNRWRIVNLVSTNGIYVNGQKRLQAYLADGDEIKLGTAALIFRTGIAAGAAGSTSGRTLLDTFTGNRLLLLALAVAVIGAAIGLWWWLR